MQPYPTGTQMPEVQRPPVPPQVANAVKAMYAGAAATIAGVVIEVLTVNATKTAIEKHSPNLSASQVASTQHVLITGAIVGGLVALCAWIVIARACQNGHRWARITGTVFFALATVDTIVSAVSPVAAPVKIWWPVIWLAGLTAVIFLWRPASTAFFKGSNE
ncbi:MAG TPA: hypothetical protein VMA97_11890 [Streptosporangiaceae bacterium]|nr:hypothetical protein [Streptosporangiaceae bacterium]